MRSIYAALLAIGIFVATLIAANRLQVWPNATLIAECGQTDPCRLQGTVTRDFFTGDYLVVDAKQTANIRVKASDWRAMAFQSGEGLGWKSMLAGLFGLAGSIAVLFNGLLLSPSKR